MKKFFVSAICPDGEVRSGIVKANSRYEVHEEGFIVIECYEIEG